METKRGDLLKVENK